MSVSPLLAASPMAFSAARTVARQLPQQAAAFARVLASVVGGPRADGDPSGSAAVQPTGAQATVDGGLVDGLQDVAIDQPAQVLRLLRRRLNDVVQRAGHGDATQGVRVRITADRGIHVVGDPPGRASIERALAADLELAQLVDRLPRAWLEAGLGMTLGGRGTDSYKHEAPASEQR